MHSASMTDTDRGLLLQSRRSFCLRTGVIATVCMAFGWLPACMPTPATISGETPPYGDNGTVGPTGTKDIGMLVTISGRGKVDIQKGSNIEVKYRTTNNIEEIEEEEEDYYLPSDETELEKFEKIALVYEAKEEIIVVVGEKVERQWGWWRYTITRDAGVEEPLAFSDAGIAIVVTTDKEFQLLKDAGIKGEVEEYDEILRLEHELEDQGLLEVSFSIYISNRAASAWRHYTDPSGDRHWYSAAW